jgi:hypothetical protein
MRQVLFEESILVFRETNSRSSPRHSSDPRDETRDGDFCVTPRWQLTCIALQIANCVPTIQYILEVLLSKIHCDWHLQMWFRLVRSRRRAHRLLPCFPQPTSVRRNSSLVSPSRYHVPTASRAIANDAHNIHCPAYTSQPSNAPRCPPQTSPPPSSA